MGDFLEVEHNVEQDASYKEEHSVRRRRRSSFIDKSRMSFGIDDSRGIAANIIISLSF